jgi:hypothetical protein
MVAPDYLGLGEIARASIFWLSLCGAALFAAAGFRSAVLGEADLPPGGHASRMISLYGMIICAVGFAGFATTYFLHRRPAKEPTQAPTAASPSIESDQSISQPASKIVVIDAIDWKMATVEKPGVLTVRAQSMGLNPITNYVYSGQMVLAKSELSKDEIDKEMDEQLHDNDYSGRISENQFQQNRSLLMTFNFNYDESKLIEEMLAGRLRLYLFLTISYSDLVLYPRKLITTEYCVYYIGTFNPPIFCNARNRIYYREQPNPAPFTNLPGASHPSPMPPVLPEKK